MKLMNASGRARIVRGPEEMLNLDIGESVELTERELNHLKRHPNIRNWLHKGYLVIEGQEPPQPKVSPRDRRRGHRTVYHAPERTPDLPEGVEGVGTEIYHHGSGWYSVYHEGMPCTDVKVRKSRAEEIAQDYE